MEYRSLLAVVLCWWFVCYDIIPVRILAQWAVVSCWWSVCYDFKWTYILYLTSCSSLLLICMLWSDNCQNDKWLGCSFLLMICMLWSVDPRSHPPTAVVFCWWFVCYDEYTEVSIYLSAVVPCWWCVCYDVKKIEYSDSIRCGSLLMICMLWSRMSTAGQASAVVSCWWFACYDAASLLAWNNMSVVSCWWSVCYDIAVLWNRSLVAVVSC